MDKIAGLKEILALDPKNSFARYGIAMELAVRGETVAALAEFDALLTNDPDYTAGYFMSATTLSSSGRTAEAVERLKAGISPRGAQRKQPCAQRNAVDARRTGPLKDFSEGFRKLRILSGCMQDGFSLKEKLFTAAIPGCCNSRKSNVPDALMLPLFH